MLSFEQMQIAISLLFIVGIYLSLRLEFFKTRSKEIELNARRYEHLRTKHWSDSEYVVVNVKDVNVGTQTYTLFLLDDVIDKDIKRVNDEENK